jgi:hypothetical protein
MHASSDDLDLLSVLSVDQAENLVMHSKDCPLWLYNLCELSPAVAEALAKHKGDIYFLSLINLWMRVRKRFASTMDTLNSRA